MLSGKLVDVSNQDENYWNSICGDDYVGKIVTGYNTTKGGSMVSIGTSGYTIQIFKSYNTSKTEIRNYYIDSLTWNSWCEIALDYPSFYKDYTTLSDLASALGALPATTTILGSGDDADSFKTQGSCYVEPGVLHVPDGVYYATLYFVGGFNGSGFQVLSNMAGSATGSSYKYIRSMDEQAGSWGPWSRMDNFGCATPSALAELLGGVERYVTGVSLNDLPGGFFISNSGGIAGLPSAIAACTCLVIRQKWVSNTATIVIDVESGTGIYVRRTEWEDFVKLT